MRPHVTPQNTWAQLGLGACALLLPPLALGAALYSMLAAPDERITHTAGIQADARAALPDKPGPAALIAQPAKAQPMAGPPTAGKSEDVAWPSDRVSVQGGPVEVTSGQFTAVPVSSAEIALPPAAAVNPRMAGGTLPMVDGPPTPAAPKRANRRRAHRQQEEFPLQNWLQQIGILPRNSNGGGG